MKKYTKPNVEVVELSIKESLSDIPAAFGAINFGVKGVRKLTGASRNTVSVYAKTSQITQTTNS